MVVKLQSSVVTTVVKINAAVRNDRQPFVLAHGVYYLVYVLAYGVPTIPTFKV